MVYMGKLSEEQLCRASQAKGLGIVKLSEEQLCYACRSLKL